jgi:drug/metabolite transporter (DMT)-like permease
MLKINNQKEKAYIFLLIGITAMASASIIIKLTKAPPLVIASYRLLISSIILSLINYKRVKACSKISNNILLIFAGLSLGIHFYTWISALFLTSVANAVVLVNTSPIFISILVTIIEKKIPSKRFYLSVLVALIGVFFITYNNDLKIQIGKGEILSIIGAITFAIYIYTGRYLSNEVSFISYITYVYSIAGICLFLITILLKKPLTGYSTYTYLNFLLLALIPQLIGHSSTNYAIRILSPTFTSVVLIGETVIASVFSVIFLKETINLYKLIGISLIIIAVSYASLEEK